MRSLVPICSSLSYCSSVNIPVVPRVEGSDLRRFSYMWSPRLRFYSVVQISFLNGSISASYGVCRSIIVRSNGAGNTYMSVIDG